MAGVETTFRPPSGLDAGALLDAIRYVETAGGNWPRLEPAWMPEGAVVWAQGRRVVGTGRQLTEIALARWHQWGPQAAASWGPWQLLYHTAADLGYDWPPFLLHDEDVSYRWVLKRLAQITERGAATLEEIADAWNSGTHRDGIVPETYIQKVRDAYQRERWRRLRREE